MRALPLLAAVLAFAPCAAAQIQDVPGRQTLDLAGPWRAIVDPDSAGYVDNVGRPVANGGMGANRKSKSPGELVPYDFDTAAQLMVPGDWNTQRPELLFYEGAVWYQKDFDYTPKPGRRQFVWFGAANYHAIVFLNGKKLGEHVGGFTPFQFEVTGLLRDTGNFLIVMVDNLRHYEAVPAPLADWWNYGGLTRGVKLVDVPDTFIEDYSVQLEKGSRNRIAAWVRLNGANRRQPVTVTISEAGLSQTAMADANGVAQLTLDAHLTLWSTESPKRYEVAISTDAERVADQIGFRTIETSGKTILLNGQPVHLRGVALHAEAPIHGGRVFAESDAATLLQWAKDLGCNFVRLAHYPHDEAMARLADQMGLLVWEELPIYRTIAWEKPETLPNAQQQLNGMISRDRNRASVILWSVSSENPGGGASLPFFSALATMAHELDPTRLVTATLEPHFLDGATLMVDDPLGKLLDVISSDESLGWSNGAPDMIDHAQWKTAFDKPFVLSGFGAEAEAGRHGTAATVWTEEFQADIYRRQVAMFQRMPFLSGTIAWALADYRSPRSPLADIQDFFNRSGLISNRGERKAAFYVLRDYYRSLAEDGSRHPE